MKRVVALLLTGASAWGSHQKGIVNRDLKLENLLLTPSTDQGMAGAPTIKLCDFGWGPAPHMRKRMKMRIRLSVFGCWCPCTMPIHVCMPVLVF